VPITPLVRGSKQIVGSYGARTRADMPEILALAARGVIKPAGMVSRRFALDEIDEALGALDRGEIQGRAIVVM
jgi:S-(hydroxymethyl)glutathione dehydrogenase/alcohol dehydrogenase